MSTIPDVQINQRDIANTNMQGHSMKSLSASLDWAPIRQALARVRVHRGLNLLILSCAWLGLIWITLNPIFSPALRGIAAFWDCVFFVVVIYMAGAFWHSRYVDKMPLWIRLHRDPSALLWIYAGRRVTFNYRVIRFTNVYYYFWFADGSSFEVGVAPSQVALLLATCRQLVPNVVIGQEGGDIDQFVTRIMNARETI